MVLRALCIVTVPGAGAGEDPEPFLVSGVPCPNVVPVLWSVLRAPELCAHTDTAEGMSFAAFALAGEPGGDRLVL